MQEILEKIASVNSKINGFVWGVPAMILIIGVGLYLTIRLNCVQIRHFGHAMKMTGGKFFSKEKTAEAGSVTPFQAVCTALAATVGTGSIAGVAGAIAIGGPGAVFWMWVSAFFGMCTKFCEVTLAVRFREKNIHGDYVGGPMYFIKNGLSKKWKWLAYVFCIFATFAVFGTGNATQTNTIIASINSALEGFNIPTSSTLNLILGIALAILVAFVLLGGISRLGSVTERLVPFMAVAYIVLALGVVVINYDLVIPAFKSIFVGAFKPSSVTGGIIGSVFLTVRKGVSRGIFSNEAGLGSASIAHATSSEKNPVKQGLFGIFEVFIASFVICTLTALVILCGNRGIVNFGTEAGAELTISGFTSSYGSWVSIFTAVAMICFAFSTILGWGLYGTRCIEFIFGSKVNKPFLIIYSLICILGATVDLGVLWGISDTFNGLMAIPNLIAVALLSPVVIKLIKQYFAELKSEKKGK